MSKVYRKGINNTWTPIGIWILWFLHKLFDIYSMYSEEADSCAEEKSGEELSCSSPSWIKLNYYYSLQGFPIYQCLCGWKTSHVKIVTLHHSPNLFWNNTVALFLYFFPIAHLGNREVAKLIRIMSANLRHVKHIVIRTVVLKSRKLTIRNLNFITMLCQPSGGFPLRKVFGQEKKIQQKQISHFLILHLYIVVLGWGWVGVSNFFIIWFHTKLVMLRYLVTLFELGCLIKQQTKWSKIW